MAKFCPIFINYLTLSHPIDFYEKFGYSAHPHENLKEKSMSHGKDLPEVIEKTDAKVEQAVTVPFYRQAYYQSLLHMPLPVSTQWAEAFVIVAELLCKETVAPCVTDGLSTIADI